MTAPLPTETPDARIVWHAAARDLARTLRGERGGGRRLYVFDILPRLMRGLYAATFAGADGAVHRYLAPYYDPEALREAIQPLEQAVRWLGLRVVDGRLEIGAHTGDRLHYFLANVDAAQGAEEAGERRRQNRQAWLEAVRELTGGDLRVRSVEGLGPGPVLAASAGREHLLIRLEAEPGALADALRGLGHRGRVAIGKICAESALHRDILGEWAGRRAGA